MKRTHLSLLLLALCSSTTALAIEASTAVVSVNTTPPPELANSFNWYQPMIGATTAYTLGARGLGITVGVIDTGIDLKHAEFKGRLVQGYNAVTPNKSPTDDNGHGTHVAGIIGAAADGYMTVGIAPEVSLMPVKVLNRNGSGTEASFNAGVNYAVNAGAKILSMSLGASGPFGLIGMQQAVSAGRLVVAAAGNDGAANPSWPARYAKEAWAGGQIIAVGAVDQNSVIASWSNRAGDTKNFFVVAPGVDIASTYPNNRYVYMSGTSMATPMVSGVAADIWSYWPYLTAGNVSGIIFQTATHLGTSAAGTPDDVYGWGMVNLARALQPVGTLTVATTTSSGSKGSKTLVASSLSTNALIKSTAFSGMQLAATDDFGRGYSYALSSFTQKPFVADVDSLFANMDKQMSMVESATAHSSLAYSLYRAPSEMQRLGDIFAQPATAASTLAGFSYMQQFDCRENTCRGEFSIGANGFADRYFGLSAEYKHMPLMSTFANPYFQFAGGASHVALGYALGDYKLRMGALNAANPLDKQPTFSTTSGASGWVSEIEKRFETGTLRAAVGDIAENRSLLGSSGAEAFEMDGAKTRFASFSGAYRLNSGAALLAQASMGTTHASGNALIHASDATTRSWSLGLLQHGLRNSDDQLAFSIAQPMKVVSGTMNLALPTVDPLTGQGSFNFTSTSLASTRTETSLEAGYATPVAKADTLRFIAAYKMNANNEPGIARVVGMRYQRAF